MAEWIGKVIGNVRIDELLAHGGMAEVYLGTHLTLDRPVAIKVLHSHIERDPSLRERLQREAKVVAGFRHPNIVQVYDFDVIEGHPYIVMEYLKGPTLAVYLRDLDAWHERLSVQQAAQILKGPAAALDYAHGLGVIHRDIKPGNIMLHGAAAAETLSDHPNTMNLGAVVTDFGLLRVAGASQQTSVGTIAGTPNYMSPEQASGSAIDHRTDIYSLGVVLYEMLAGRAPFEGDTSLTVLYKHINESPPPIPGISAGEQAVIERALAKNPADRFQSCGELAAAFEAAIAEPQADSIGIPAAATLSAGVPASVSGPSTSTTNGASQQISEPQITQKKSWGLPAAIAGALVLVLGIGAFLILPRFGEAPKQAGQQPTSAVPTTVPASIPATGASDLPLSEGMLKVAAGNYHVGLDPSDDFHAAQQTIQLAEFWIDMYPVTNEQYQAYVQQAGAPAPQLPAGGAKQPVRGVTWDQASAYCAWLKKRLPTEAEWEAAGRGLAANPPLFPWGNDPTDGGKVLQMPDQDTYEVGSQAFNVSSLGVYDLVGEVWHWVGDAYANTPQGFKVLRGGRFGLPQDLAYRIVVAPDDSRYQMFAGFRCAATKVR